MLISSFCVFRIANRYTFRALFGRDLTDQARRAAQRQMLGDLVVAYLTGGSSAAQAASLSWPRPGFPGCLDLRR